MATPKIEKIDIVHITDTKGRISPLQANINSRHVMLFEFCTDTNPGMIRDNNEDAVVVDASTGVCVLADGMGGYNAGEIASSMACAFVNSEMSRWLAQEGKSASAKEVKRALESCAQSANRSIIDAAQSNPQYSGMGTTLVVGVFQAGRLMLGHIGDSRCYRLRGDELLQITKDHSLLQEQIDAGLITPEQALTSPRKNLVTRALGVEDAVLLEVTEHRVEEGDLYMMCSDGLSDMVRDAFIADILIRDSALEEKGQQLISAANESGGRDNISVVLTRAGQASSKPGFLSRMLGK